MISSISFTLIVMNVISLVIRKVELLLLKLIRRRYGIRNCTESGHGMMNCAGYINDVDSVLHDTANSLRLLEEGGRRMAGAMIKVGVRVYYYYCEWWPKHKDDRLLQTDRCVIQYTTNVQLRTLLLGEFTVK